VDNRVSRLPLGALSGKSVVSIRKLIIIGASIVLSTPALSQGYNGPSAEQIREAVRDGVLDALRESGQLGEAPLGKSDKETIREAVRDGILAADEARRAAEEAGGYQLFLQQQEVARRNRCKVHPSWACQ
jgi:hypothetical protein